MKIDEFLEKQYVNNSYYFVMQRFLRKKRRDDLSNASLKHLCRSLYALGETVGLRPISAIDSRDMKDYVDSLKLRYSPGTLRSVVGDIKQFFKWAKKKKWVKKNPAKRLRKPRSRKAKNKAASEVAINELIAYLVEPLRSKELVFRDLFGSLAAAEKSEWSYEELMTLRDLFILVFLYETGARGGEVASLPVRSMDKATAERQNAYVVVSWGKEDDRELRFTERSAELWRLWRSLRPHDILPAVYSWRRGQAPRQFTTNGISQMLVRRGKKANIPLFRTHALRHAKINRSRKIVGPKLASSLVDHSSMTTTLGYIYVDDDELEQATVATGLQHDFWNGHRT